MYKRILVAIENSPADRTILDHVARLGRLTGASLLLVHVADGWAARHYDDLQLRESEEMIEDRGYLERLRSELRANGFDVETVLLTGDPARELVKVIRAENVDLVAMATHGHKGVADVIHGSTVNHVRHNVTVPVLLLKAQPPQAQQG
jgi:nucleotide-binding universal stress UspA family protein